MLHVLLSYMAFPGDIGHRATVGHAQQAAHITQPVRAGIPRLGSRPLPIVAPKLL